MDPARRFRKNPGEVLTLRDSIDQDSAVGRALLHMAIVLAGMEFNLARERNVVKQEQVNSVRGLMEMEREELRKLSERFKIKIEGLFKHTSGGRSPYLIKINGQLVNLGGIGNLRVQNQVINRVADATMHLIPKVTPSQWNLIVQDMLDACEEMPEEAPAQDEADSMSQWIQEYLSENPSTDDVNDAAMTEQPFMKGGEIHIRLGHFKRWIVDKHGLELANYSLEERLKECGAVRTKKDVMLRGKRTSRSLWKLHRPSSTVGQ